ncbi:MAG: acyl carrier protein [Myxococcales bacterium]|nr:acyl carrier protein [Myxococcales bacterium]
MRAAIETFIRQNFYVPDDVALAADTSLLDSGIVDSTGVLEIVAYLETEHGITVDDMEILPENLDSVAAIDAFLARKRGREGSAA